MSESPAYSRTQTNLLGYITDINLLSAEQRRKDEESLALQRTEFRNALSGVLAEDQFKGEDFRGLGAQASYYIDDDGKLTDGFIQELNKLAQEEAKLFELNLVQAHPPQADCFGIKRRFCEVCREECIGYESCNQVIPSSSKEKEFPTFCSRCDCPAYFHKIAEESTKFPDDFAEMLTSHNIQEQDLNFNSVLAVFLIKDEKKALENVSEITQLLISSGIEVVQLQKRHVSSKEAFYLQNRIVTSTQKLISNQLDEQSLNLQRETEIKRNSNLNQLAIDRLGEINPFLIELITKQKEQDILRMKNKFTGHLPNVQSPRKSTLADSQVNFLSPRSSNPQGSPQQNVQRAEMLNKNSLQLSPVREVAESVLSDDLDRAIEPLSEKDQAEYQKRYKELDRKSLMPSKRSTFKFGRTSSVKPQQAQIVDVDLQHKTKNQVEFLIRMIEQDPILRELTHCELILAVFNSTQYQNIVDIVFESLNSFQALAKEVPMIYISTNKVQGLEDCVQFCPQMFALQKSIVVSEPAKDFKQFLAQRIGVNQQSTPRPDEKKLQGYMLKTKIQDLKKKVAREFQPGFSPQKRKILSQSDSLTKFDREQKTRTQNLKQAQPDWVKRIKEKEQAKITFDACNSKRSHLQKSNPTLFNFGVMQDFFNYSGMNVQTFLKSTDLTKPLCPAGIRGGVMPLVNISSMKSQPCNIFQIAKVGLPNIIFPNSLDVKLSNFQDFDSLITISDMFFPEHSKEQQTVLIFRPVIVKNQLNEIFIQILRSNSFLILKRKVRVLKKSEIIYLFEQEKIDQANAALYFDVMNSGPAEIVIVSKIGGVCDAKTLFNGAAPFGRRRINQLNESKSKRINLKSIDGMFEIAPFSSFSELFDIEDFLIRNGKIKKYKTLSEFKKLSSITSKSVLDREKMVKQSKTAETLYFTKIQELRQEIDALERQFNFAGFASNSIESAEKEVCIFAPSLAQLEEVVFVLNPIYNSSVGDAFELILRASFTILAHSFMEIGEDEIDSIFRKKYGQETKESELLYDSLLNANVHIFHLTKVAADRECRERFYQSNIMFDDLINPHQLSIPLQPQQIPFLFFFLDLEETFEHGLKLLYEEKLLSFTGSDFCGKIEKVDVHKILQTCLLTTVGDKIQVLHVDAKGNSEPVTFSEKDFLERDNFNPINNYEHVSHEYGVQNDHHYQVQQQAASFEESSQTIRFAVEAQTHGLYEIKIHRLAHRGDTNKFDALSSETQITAKQEAKKLFQQFISLSFYYNEVNKISFNICPSFYKFKIQPFDDVLDQQPVPDLSASFDPLSQSLKTEDINQEKNQLNRVFEVEEYMGGDFIEELAQMHFDHLKIIEHARFAQTQLSATATQQKSLPTFIYGGRLAEMCKTLEQIKCHQSDSKLKGAGKMIFNDSISFLEGEMPKITESSYFRFDKERYLQCLDNFKQGWDYYLSVLESQVIEVKLMTILDSLTFKYSRQPQFLRVYPDRLTVQNLRISKKIKILDQQSLGDKATKFYKPLNEIQINPNRELEISANVSSVMKTLVEKNLKQRLNQKLKRMGTDLDRELRKQADENENNKFSITKDCSLSGFQGIARRPKYHLLANILWLIDFSWRKLERKHECFLGDRQANRNTLAEVEKEYDQILDILKTGLCKNFGNDEVNQALNCAELKQGSLETEFEKSMRVKNEKSEQRLKFAQKIIEEERRKRRNDPSTDIADLIQTEIWDAIDSEHKKQREEWTNFMDRGAMMDPDGAKFMQHLETSRIKFGPYALKIAEDFIQKQRLLIQEQINPGKNFGQEKISFVQMEYFLFGVAEADRLIEQLKVMEVTINMLQDELERRQEQARKFVEKIKSLKVGVNITEEAFRRMDKKHQSLQPLINEKLKDVQDYRYRVSMKETELLLIFRELASVELFVPDHLFQQQLVVKKDKKVENYIVPFKTFWKPVHVDEWIEPDLNQDKYLKPVNQMPYLNEQNYGEFLAPSLRQSLTLREKEKIQKLQKGGLDPGLYQAKKTVYPEQIVMEKFSSKGDMKQSLLIAEQKELIHEKTTKVKTLPKNPFQFDQ